jgi:hypothetical protein
MRPSLARGSSGFNEEDVPTENPRDWVPDRIVTLTNLSTGVTLITQFVPAALEAALEVEYARITVPGLSHQPLQFVRTGNLVYTMELYFRATTPDELASLKIAEKFLHSACYPRGDASSVATGAPARLMFVWPHLVTITAVITGLGFNYSRFSTECHATAFTVRLTLEEILDVRLLAEQVWQLGTRRGSNDGLWQMVHGDTRNFWELEAPEEAPEEDPD